MKIIDSLYQLLLREVPSPPPETGGILGGNRDVITHYCFDRGRCTLISPAHYQPNTRLLNQMITKWQVHNIQFCGLFHSHYPSDTELSPDDRKYIIQIMLAMPSDIPTLYFPLILPGTDIIGYQADRCGSDVLIVCDKIEILKTEVSLQ